MKKRVIVWWLVSALVVSCSSLASTEGVVAQSSKEPLWSTYTAQSYIGSVAISSNGSYIAVGSSDKKVYLLSSSGSVLWSKNTNQYVVSVAISSDGNYVAAGTYDSGFPGDSGSIRWYSQSGQDVWGCYGGSVRSVAISSDGSYIAAGVGYSGGSGLVYLFSRGSGVPQWSYSSSSPIWSVSISSDGQYIVAGDADSKVYLFGRSSSTPLWTSTVYSGKTAVWTTAISSNGDYIVAGDANGKVHLFSRSDNTPIWSYSTGSLVNSVAISQFGDYIAAGANDGKIYAFAMYSSSPLWSYQAGGTSPSIESVSISADGSYIVAGSSNKEVYSFSRTSSTPQWTYGNTYSASSVVISSDGKYVASSDYFYIRLFARGNAPSLSSGSVSPSYGSSGTTFTYEVTYTHAGGSAPSYVKIYIDNTEYPMSYVSGSYTTGAIYRYTTSTLSTGSHNYYFSASDGTYTARLPTSGTYSGPNVGVASTTLSISPSSFNVSIGGSQSLTATLTSGGSPLAGKTVSWSTTAGSVYPSSGTTNSSGQTTTTYTAPSYATSTTITASFAGDSQYAASSGNSYGTVQFSVTLTFTKPDGTPLANTTIYYGTSKGQETAYLGTTDANGNLTSTNSALAGQTVYFKSSDGRYTGSTYVGSSGGYASAPLTEAAAFPWLAILALVVVCGAVGGVVLAWKRGPKRSSIIASAGALGFIVPFLLTLSWSAIGAFLIGGFVSAWCAVVAYWGVKAKAHMEVRAKARPKPPKHAPPEQAKPAGKFCTYCKLKLPADAEFCPECGRKVK